MQASKYTALSHAAPSARPKYVSYDELLAPAPPIPAGDDGSAAKPAAAAAASAAGDGFLVHTVEKRDTLMGLSLRYGVTITDIRVANDLPSENIAFLKTLRIPVRGGKAAAAAVPRAPVGERDSERSLIRRLAVTHRLSEAEAKYYLEEAAWDYDAAEREFLKEASFEAAHAGDAAAAVAAATVVPAAPAASSSSTRATVTPSAASTAAAAAGSGRHARVIEDGVDPDDDGVAMTLLASADTMAAGLVPTRSGGGDGSTARVSALNPKLVGGSGGAAAAGEGGAAADGGLRKRTLPGSFL